MKNAVFWDMTPCDTCNRRFEGTYHRHPQSENTFESQFAAKMYLAADGEQSLFQQHHNLFGEPNRRIRRSNGSIIKTPR
jgi:hypothetical protein